MGEEIVGDGLAAGAQLSHGPAEIDGVPEDDGGDGQVQPRGTVALILEGAVSDFSMAVEE